LPIARERERAVEGERDGLELAREGGHVSVAHDERVFAVQEHAWDGVRDAVHLGLLHAAAGDDLGADAQARYARAFVPRERARVDRDAGDVEYVHREVRARVFHKHRVRLGKIQVGVERLDAARRERPRERLRVLDDLRRVRSRTCSRSCTVAVSLGGSGEVRTRWLEPRAVPCGRATKGPTRKEAAA